MPKRGGLLVEDDGSILAGEAGLIVAVDKAWWPLWRPEQDGRTRAPRFEQLGEGSMPPLSVDMLWAACKSTGVDKAPGADGWTARHMCEWSGMAWEAVRELLVAVELAGRWPRKLQGGLVCLLPKGGISPSIEDPLQARPVVLLAVLYRVWAKARAPWLAEWIRLAGVQPVEEAGGACEDLAVDLAFAFEEARAVGGTAWAVATDLSKAYDRIPLEVLSDGLRDMGLPVGLWKPLWSMASSERQIKVLNVVGSRKAPTHGLVPGCPLATFTMGLILHRWRVHIWRAIPYAMKRCWVDDSTAAVIGGRLEGLKLALANSVAFEELEATDAMRVNQNKSGFLASHEKEGSFVAGILAERALWPTGGVVVLGDPGEGEPEWVERAPNLMRGSLEDEREAMMVAARASVIVEGRGALLPAAGREVAEVVGCVVLKGLWRDLSLAEHGRAQAQLKKHGEERRWQMELKKTLKDLGVAQGVGKDAKDLAAQRHVLLQDRTRAIARLAVPAWKAEQLVATSGLPAGLYGAGAHVPDGDTLRCMRKWVLHACYRGSRFMQAALWFVFAARTWRSDPVKVWCVKAAEAVARQVANRGRDVVGQVWQSSKDGPVAGLKFLLHQVGVEAGPEEWSGGGRVLQGPLEASPAVRKEFLLGAIQSMDLQKAAARKGQEGIRGVDVSEARRLLATLPKGGLREALLSVFVGDCVVRAVTKHWQGHDGRCACGLAAETKGHIFWDCPGTVQQRLALEAGRSHQERPPKGVEREMGLPPCEPAVKRWIADWVPPPREEVRAWRARHLYVDASARYPKLTAIRTVGWVVTDGKGQARGGVLQPGTSVGWGETFAIIEAYAHCESRSIIWSDCQAATKLWRRCLQGGASRYAGALQALVPELRRARELLPQVQVVWIPSHKTCEEFVALGRTAEVWQGNEVADREAKARAALCVAPPVVVARFQQARERAEGVARVVAGVQLARLQQRLRTEEGHAVKARKRRPPGGLRRLQPGGAKKVCLRRADLPDGGLRDLLMPANRARVSASQAGRLLELAEAKEGFHDLWPLGPWPVPGSRTATNGRLVWPWGCRRCNASASDSSRAVALARVPCGAPAWTANFGLHAVVQIGADAYSCRRCGRKADAAHRSSLAEAACSVPEVHRGPNAWLEGEECLGLLLGRVAAFRRWAEPDPTTKEHPQAEPVRDMPVAGGPLGPGPQPAAVSGEGGGARPRLVGYREHCIGLVSRKLLCCACFQVAEGGGWDAFRYSACPGVQPAERAPPFLFNAVRRGALRPEGLGGQARVEALGRALAPEGCRPLRLGAGPSGGRPPSSECFERSVIGAAFLAASRAGR